MQFHSGLWKFCQSNPAATGGGSRSGFCQSYHVPITQLPPYLLFQRALMVLSVLFGTIAMIVAFCATDAVNAVKTADGKNKVSKASGVVFIIISIMTLTAVSLEASKIVTKSNQIIDYRDYIGFNAIHFTLGPDLYVGWISSIFGFVTGGLLIMGGCGNNEENEFEETYPVAKYESGTIHRLAQDQTQFSSKPENHSMQKTQMSQYV